MTSTLSLAERVAQMRSLGVQRWREGDFEIELGPVPVEPEKPSISEAVRRAVGDVPPRIGTIDAVDPLMGLTEEEQTDLFNAVISPVKVA